MNVVDWVVAHCLGIYKNTLAYYQNTNALINPAAIRRFVCLGNYKSSFVCIN